MPEKIKELAQWLWEQGREITQGVLEEKLEEAYRQGKADAHSEQVDSTLADIQNNTELEIKKRMRTLYEQNFYNVPSEEDKIKMRAYEFLLDNISQIIKEYQKGPSLKPYRAEPDERG
jgi:hypothetical protein